MADLSRRRFFGGMGAILAGGAVASAAPSVFPDHGTINGYACWWSGWRKVPAQDVELGWWTAEVAPTEQGDRVMSTVCGRIMPAWDLYQVDGTYTSGWPVITSRSTEADRAAVKQRAALALVEALHG